VGVSYSLLLWFYTSEIPLSRAFLVVIFHILSSCNFLDRCFAFTTPLSSALFRELLLVFGDILPYLI